MAAPASPSVGYLGWYRIFLLSVRMEKIARRKRRSLPPRNLFNFLTAIFGCNTTERVQRSSAIFVLLFRIEANIFARYTRRVSCIHGTIYTTQSGDLSNEHGWNAILKIISPFSTFSRLKDQFNNLSLLQGDGVSVLGDLSGKLMK